MFKTNKPHGASVRASRRWTRTDAFTALVTASVLLSLFQRRHRGEMTELFVIHSAPPAGSVSSRRGGVRRERGGGSDNALTRRVKVLSDVSREEEASPLRCPASRLANTRRRAIPGKNAPLVSNLHREANVCSLQTSVSASC